MIIVYIVCLQDYVDAGSKSYIRTVAHGFHSLGPVLMFVAKCCKIATNRNANFLIFIYKGTSEVRIVKK